jgi:dodecin
MTPGEVAEIHGSSKTSIEDAIKRGLAGANKTLQNVRSLWMKDQRVRIHEGSPHEYQVAMVITFVAADWQTIA